MKRFLYLIIICALGTTARAQHVFKGTSLSKALIELDQSTKRYDISFVYDELEDFTVTKTIKRGQSVPEAVREVCGFYPALQLFRCGAVCFSPQNRSLCYR